MAMLKKTDKTVYIVVERDFELNIFAKALTFISNYIEVKTQMTNTKTMDIPYTMMLSYFKIAKKSYTS